jgi:hypothetical protein
VPRGTLEKFGVLPPERDSEDEQTEDEEVGSEG